MVSSACHTEQQLGNLPPLCKNIAGGWTQNSISIIFAKYRLVSEVLGIWFLRRAISNFVHNFLLISVKDWYSCQLLIFWSDDIVCWSKFPDFDMSGLPKIKRDFEFTFDWILKNLAFAPKKYLFPVTSNMFIFLWKPFFLFQKFRSWPKDCCETRYPKSTLNYGCCWNGRESDKTSTIT